MTLRELTPRHRELISEVTNDWLAFIDSGKQVQESDVRHYLKHIYSKAGLPEPAVEIRRRPFIILIHRGNEFFNVQSMNMMTGITNPVMGVVTDELTKLSIDVSLKVSSKLRDVIGSTILAEYNDRRWDRYTAATAVTSEEAMFPHDGIPSGNPWPLWDFYLRAGIASNEAVEDHIEYLKTGVFTADYKKAKATIYALPELVRRDGEGHLHCLDGPALRYAGDDGGKIDLYFIRDVAFDRKLWQRIVSRKITAKEAISLQNAEQRTIACTMLGYSRVIEELGAKVVHEEVRKGLKYQLLEVNLNDDGLPARFIKMEDATTHKESLLRVDPRCETCHQAVAWTFGRTEWPTWDIRYDPAVET